MKKLTIIFILLMMVMPSQALIKENGATSVITYFTMRDRTTGIRDTGVVIANLEMYYIEEQTAISADVFVGAHGAATDAYTSGECIHVGQGEYRVDWPDAAFDGGIGTVVELILVDGDSGAFTEGIEVMLSPPVDTVTVGQEIPFDSTVDGVLLEDTDHVINSLEINAGTGDAFRIISSGGGGNAVYIAGDGNGDGILIESGLGAAPNSAGIRIESVGPSISLLGTPDLTADFSSVLGMFATLLTDPPAGKPAEPTSMSVLEFLSYRYMDQFNKKETTNITATTGETKVLARDEATVKYESDFDDDGTTFTKEEAGAED